MTAPTESPAPLPQRSLPDLESDLLGLAGNIAAAECRFLRLLAEFDSRGGWAGVGIRSCAHWLSWRAGMSLRTATEHLRVAHALTRLPQVTAEFAAGRLSYSKVRALTRVIGSDDAALERITAMARTGTLSPDLPDDSDKTAPTGDDGIAARQAGSATSDTGAPSSNAAPQDSLGHIHTGHGPTTGTGTGTGTETGIGTVGREPLAASDGRSDDTSTIVGATTPVDPATAERILLDLALSGTASHVETIVRAVRRQATPPAETAARRTLAWYHDADGSLVLRGRFTPEDGAVLIAAIESRLPAEAPESVPATDSPGARRADALLDAVRHPADESSAPVVTKQTAQVVVHVDVTSGSARIAGGPDLPGPTAERLTCDARAQLLLEDRRTNRLYLGRSRRLASPAQIAALTTRSPGCGFPGCDDTRHLHAHHVRHWLHGGGTDIDNLVLLCGNHHRLVHEHGYRIRRRTDGTWAYLRPDGTPVRATGTPLTGTTGGVVARNIEDGCHIDRSTLTPDWCGDRLDVQAVLDALLPPHIPVPRTAVA